MLAVDVSPVDAGVVELFGVAAKAYPAVTIILEGEVELKAVPAPGYRFVGWSGDVTSKDNPLVLVMDCSKVVRAIFSLIRYTLTLEVEGGGRTEPLAGPHDYSQGSTVDIVAIPDKGWLFERWKGNVADPASASTTVKLDSDRVVTAVFRKSWATPWLVGGITAALLAAGVIAYRVRRRQHLRQPDDSE